MGRVNPTFHKLRFLAEKVLDLNPQAPDFARQLTLAQEYARAVMKEENEARMGSPWLSTAREISAEVRQKQFEERRTEILAILEELRGQGITSYPQLAKALNERGIKPPRAKEWTGRNLYAVEKPQER